MSYFVVPYNGGYKVVAKDDDSAKLCSPWFETYSLAEKWLERMQKKQQAKNGQTK